MCVYMFLKKLAGLSSANERVLEAAKKLVKSEKLAEKMSGNLSKKDQNAIFRQHLLEQIQLEMASISESEAYIGQGSRVRPFIHIVKSIKVATGVKSQIQDQELTAFNYLLSRGVENYHSIQNTQTVNDRTFAYCNVLSTSSKAVCCFVEFCLEKNACKSMALISEEDQKGHVCATLKHDAVKNIADLIFDPSVMYLIACHIAKRLLFHSDNIEYHALREFATSHTDMICMHKMNNVINRKKQDEIHNVSALINVDRFLTYVPLEEAYRINLTTASSDILKTLRNCLTDLMVSETRLKTKTFLFTY